MSRESLIYKVISGTASDSEKKELAQWLELTNENKEEFENLKALLQEGSQFDLTTADFESVKKRMFLNQKKSIRDKRSRMAIGILFAGLIVGGVIWIMTFDKGQQKWPDRLVFNKTPLAEVIRRVETSYHVRISLEDKRLASCPFTGIFLHVANVEELLKSLDEALNISHQRVHENEYLLSGPGCNPVKHQPFTKISTHKD